MTTLACLRPRPTSRAPDLDCRAGVVGLLREPGPDHRASLIDSSWTVPPAGDTRSRIPARLDPSARAVWVEAHAVVLRLDPYLAVDRRD